MCNLHIFRQLIMNKKIKKIINIEKRHKNGWKEIVYPNISNVEELKFPYFIKLELSNGETVTEKVVDRKDEERIKKLFPEMFENNN
tara:strand:+ start:1206 stop:1463 length:258 start_codon:yes stop_codon:yes gene_type:complete